MSLTKRLRENWVKILATGMVVFGMMAPAAAAATTQPRDCDLNSIMYCGAYSKSEWLGKVKSGDTKHTASDIQHIYYSEGRGITEANFNSAQTVDGLVYKDGRVVVGGKTVATNAKSIGREYMAGSVKSGTVWMRPTSISFAADSIPAWVNMDGNSFHYFVIKSCGNAGIATPVAKPTPSPTPTPTHTPTPTPTPTPVSSFSCEALTPTRPDVEHRPNLYRYTVTPKVSNATVTGYKFVSTDQSGQVTTPADRPYIEKEIKIGSVTVRAQVVTDKGTTPISEQCSATVNVTTPTPTPTPGQVLGTVTLPATGPEAALGGIAGLSAIGLAGRHYVRSRKSLLGALRNTNK